MGHIKGRCDACAAPTAVWLVPSGHIVHSVELVPLGNIITLGIIVRSSPSRNLEQDIYTS